MTGEKYFMYMYVAIVYQYTKVDDVMVFCEELALWFLTTSRIRNAVGTGIVHRNTKFVYATSYSLA